MASSDVSVADTAHERAASPGLSVRLLGSPVMEVDGAPLEVDTRKAVALLAYLAATMQPHSRDSLALLLWPDYDDARAHGALRRTLSVLKKGLTGRWVTASRSTIELQRAGVWVDLVEFRDAIASYRAHSHAAGDLCDRCRSGLQRTVALHRGGFLTGLGVRDSAEFDDWQLSQGETVNRELAEALEALAADCARRGRVTSGLEHARRLLALDPLHEPAHRRVMELMAAAGDRTGSLKQYRDCVAILDTELGVAPLQETTELYEAIKQGLVPSLAPGTVAESAEGAAPTVAHDRARLPLVGRQREWAALVDAYSSARRDGRLVAIEGEAGIGKTRLAEELVEHAATRGARAIEARCYEEEAGLPYAAVISLLTSLPTEGPAASWATGLPPDSLPEAARLAPALASLGAETLDRPPIDNPAARALFFSAVTEVLTAGLAGNAPGVLFVDDVQWADGSSIELLVYLARRLRGRPICVVLTWRAEALAESHVVRRLVAELKRSRSATHVVPERLAERDVLYLLRSLSDRAGLESLAPRLHEETEGLPFFVSEYLEVLGSERDVRTWELPVGVRDLLQERVAPLGETASQVMSAAAVVGRSFDLDTVRDASGRSDEEIVAALEELVSSGIVREVVGERPGAPVYDFGHEKVRRFVYERTGLARRRLLHRRVARGLLRRRPGRELATEAATAGYHLRQAGEDGRAAELFKIAGDRAKALFANEQALAHYGEALSLGHPDASALHEEIGDLHVLMGGYGDALSAYERAAARLTDDDGLVRLEHKLGSLHVREGRWDLAESHLSEALRRLGDPGARPDAAARIYADASLAAHRKGDGERALELARRALVSAQMSRDERALAQAHNVLGILATHAGEPDEARVHLEKSLSLARELQDMSAAVAAENNLAIAFKAAGDIPRAIEHTRSALDSCTQQGDLHRQAALHNNLADLLYATGQADAAMSHVKRSAAIFSDVGEGGAMQPEIWKLVEW